jgi:putative Mg2+ transporter-C (MgtC) family protein
MEYIDFVIRLCAAFALGGAIGLERQWRQRLTGLRTNSLVAVGACLFVLLGGELQGPESQARLASYVISGIGFLGGGVILKDGFSISGLNTAATLWCTAAVGALSGAGFLAFAAGGAGAVLAANVLLRPLAQKIHRNPAQAQEAEISYRFLAECRANDESHIRTLLLQNLSQSRLLMLALESQDLPDRPIVRIAAQLKSDGRRDAELEQIVSRLSLESSVTTIRWEVLRESVDGEAIRMDMQVS